MVPGGPEAGERLIHESVGVAVGASVGDGTGVAGTDVGLAGAARGDGTAVGVVGAFWLIAGVAGTLAAVWSRTLKRLLTMKANMRTNATRPKTRTT